MLEYNNNDESKMNHTNQVPDVTFKTRVRDESVEGPNPFRWEDTTTNQLFARKRLLSSPCREHSRQPVRQITCRVMKNSMTSSKHWG